VIPELGQVAAADGLAPYRVVMPRVVSAVTLTTVYSPPEVTSVPVPVPPPNPFCTKVRSGESSPVTVSSRAMFTASCWLSPGPDAVAVPVIDARWIIAAVRASGARCGAPAAST
jgi:hypothetical protein